MNTLYQLITKQALIRPSQIALHGEDYLGVIKELNYNQLIIEIDKLAKIITELEIRCIALRSHNCIDWALIDLAALKCGIPLIPVPLFFSTSQVTHLLTSSGADCLIGDWLHTEHLDNTIKYTNDIANMPVYRIKNTVSKALIDGTIKITFTSGSTGMPKGVCLSENNLINVSLALANAIEIKPKCHLTILPLSTLLENITGIYVPLLLGAKSYLFQGKRVGLMGSSQLDIHQFAASIAQFKPNTLVLTPALLKALIAVTAQNPALASPLQFVAVGGARVPEILVNQAKALNIPVYEGYGLSESASVVSLNTPTHQKAGSCGKALSHVETFVDEQGELFIRGNIALGYIGAPFNQEWLATGDIAKKDTDGFLTILGRKKNIIITSFGRNISPEWIESELSSHIPFITYLIFGEGQDKLGLLVDLPTEYRQYAMNSEALIDFKKMIVDSLTKFNTTLPDYARIADIRIIKDLTYQPGLFTNNGKVKRENINTCLDQIESKALDSIHIQL
ncbi:AMP-binding protein [Thorsellia anophelis]|uniref:Long-chain acyl-CoA synthetase (AMP-forming) n=1 Tax=Thorsellia anophelis DSM 18579 TaxID=1123402 RepID=A0A1I0EXU9_9GAMM|nr:AMP-binding protein [Thorsellia anophelis]SET50295.1 Long-chain acyl-CoA synthetase (AMP-forming) [Thorsellia anophelis DSM 18579]